MTEHIEDGIIRSNAKATGADAGGSGADAIDMSSADGDSKVVTARGTEDGLVLRIDGKAEWDDILRDIELFLGGRKKFFEGGQVSLEWLDRLPTLEQSKQLEDLLQNEYGIALVVKRKRPSRLALASQGAGAAAGAASSSAPSFSAPSFSASAETSIQQQGWGASAKDMSIQKDAGARQKRTGVTINLFDEVSPGSATIPNGLAEELEILNTREEIGEMSDDDMVPVPPSRPSASRDGSSRDGGLLSEGLGAGGKKFASRMAKMLGDDLFYEDDANAKVFFGTLRSGQRLETPFSLIVVGDVNPGADLVAGGDIIVFGGLRGTAHASAYDDDSFDRVIIALQMQPMQLRIGSVISRGSDELVRGAEIARIENRRIIVESFNPKTLPGTGAAAKKIR